MPNWNAVLKEVSKAQKQGDKAPFDTVRRKYLAQLNKHTERNIIAYYSGFMSKPKTIGVDITDEDKNGFMACVHKMNRAKGLDLFLHTPGGDIAATESLVHYLKEMFGNNIRAVIPQIAMSAGTMIACSCNSILMGKHSNISPVDPQFNGIPAIGVIEELKKAFEEIKIDNRAALLWNPILSRLPPSFLQQCHWAIQRSGDFLRKSLDDGMLRDLPEPDKANTVNQIVGRLTDLTYNKGHNRHIHYQECIDLGLNIEMLENSEDRNLQDLVLTVHHCFMHTLANTASFKIIEDHRGRATIKHQIEQQLQVQLPPGGLPAVQP